MYSFKDLLEIRGVIFRKEGFMERILERAKSRSLFRREQWAMMCQLPMY